MLLKVINAVQGNNFTVKNSEDLLFRFCHLDWHTSLSKYRTIFLTRNLNKLGIKSVFDYERVFEGISTRGFYILRFDTFSPEFLFENYLNFLGKKNFLLKELLEGNRHWLFFYLVYRKKILLNVAWFLH